jgi:hypothetical protein
MWRFSNKTGKLYDPVSTYVATGYSGFPPHVLDPSAQYEKGVGPIPVGRYHFGAPYDSPNVGPFAIPIEALPGTDTKGRGDFKCHGDSRIHPGAASHGCMIFPRFIREMIAKSDDKLLEVFTEDDHAEHQQPIA